MVESIYCIFHIFIQACRVIVACAILHNIAKRRGVPVPPSDAVPQPQLEEEAAGQTDTRQIAQAPRQHFITEHFTNVLEKFLNYNNYVNVI